MEKKPEWKLPKRYVIEEDPPDKTPWEQAREAREKAFNAFAGILAVLGLGYCSYKVAVMDDAPRAPARESTVWEETDPVMNDAIRTQIVSDGFPCAVANAVYKPRDYQGGSAMKVQCNHGRYLYWVIATKEGQLYTRMRNCNFCLTPKED